MSIFTIKLIMVSKKVVMRISSAARYAKWEADMHAQNGEKHHIHAHAQYLAGRGETKHDHRVPLGPGTPSRGSIPLGRLQLQ